LAYAIGLIVSDGWIAHDERHVCLKSAEIDLINQFRNSLGITNKISLDRGRSRIHYRTQFGDKAFCAFLNTLGITRNKSKTIGPVAIPNNYFGHFLRGVFDGDGTCYFSWDKRWPSSFVYNIAFASASPIFIRWLKEKMTLLFGVKGYIKRGAGVENLVYNKNDCRRLADVMYIEHQNLYLNRKLIRLGGCMIFDKMLRLLPKERLPAEVAQR
jgi:hypothetical protein